jgi:osmotically-inducible protein OsmY
METSADYLLQRAIKDMLVDDQRVDAEKISAVALGGNVTLRGFVPTAYEKNLAAELAAKMEGVTEVRNELVVESPRPRLDEDIAADVRDAIKQDDYVDSSAINVECSHGTVILTGEVQHRWERANAELDAWSAPGVLQVVDNIGVISNPSRPDEEIKRQIKGDMVKNIRLDPSRVDVEVADGVVRLSGRVPTLSQKWLAADESWRTPGVREVVNEIAVE